MNHVDCMKLALNLAEAARGQTSPNPMVGCVIVKDGELVGTGCHLKAGEPHAEVHALRMAGEKAKGATAYVTLEPCSHFGRTPPCADALIESGVQTVVIAMLDPNPVVAGRGADRMRQAGIKVISGVLEKEALQLNEVFVKYIRTRRPFVTVKTASTLDGKVATATGSSRWITGEAARLDVHQLRHDHDAILVGINTVIMDDPRLTTRLPLGGRNPIRIIVDSTLRIPLSARVITDAEAPTWIFTTDQADQDKWKKLTDRGIRVFSTGNEPLVNVDELLKVLGEHEIISLLVEGGGQINSAFLQAQAIDKLIAYIAPKLVGGQEAPSTFAGLGIKEMADAISLQDVQIKQVEEDLRITGYPVWEGSDVYRDH